MKKIRNKAVALLALCCVLMSLASYPTAAATVTVEEPKTTVTSSTIEIDGYYLTTELIVIKQARGTLHTAYKGVKLSDKNNVTLCEFFVQGQFDINYGVSVVCTNAKPEYSSADSQWSVVKMSTSKGTKSSGAAYAYAAGTFQRRVLGIAIKNIPTNVELICNKYGELY